MPWEAEEALPAHPPEPCTARAASVEAADEIVGGDAGSELLGVISVGARPLSRGHSAVQASRTALPPQEALREGGVRPPTVSAMKAST